MMTTLSQNSSASAHQINHHPSEALLMDYAIGALSEGFDLAIEIHLECCPQCRADLQLMREIGGKMLEDSVSLNAAGLPDDLLAHLPAQDEAMTGNTVAPIPVGSSFLPDRLAGVPQYADGSLKFKPRAPGIATIPLVREKDGTYARLMRIAAGKSVPHHSHHGIELTVLIAGSYHDEISTYWPGDFVEHGPEVRHQPIADKAEDCICLGVTEGPLVFSKPAYNLLRPFFPV